MFSPIACGVCTFCQLRCMEIIVFDPTYQDPSRASIDSIYRLIRVRHNIRVKRIQTTDRPDHFMRRLRASRQRMKTLRRTEHDLETCLGRMDFFGPTSELWWDDDYAIAADAERLGNLLAQCSTSEIDLWIDNWND